MCVVTSRENAHMTWFPSLADSYTHPGNLLTYKNSGLLDMRLSINPSTWELGTDRSLQVLGQPSLHREFHASQGYSETLPQKYKDENQNSEPLHQGL